MERVLKTLALTAVVMAAVACNKEEEPIVIQEGSREVTLTASITDVSKVAIDDAGKLTWVTGDQIRVFYTDNDGAYSDLTLSDGAGTATGKFTGTLRGADIAFVMYPARGFNYSKSGDNLSLTLPNAYDLREGKQAEIPMFGKVSGTDVAFTHTCGMIRFHMKHLPKGSGRLRFFANLKLKGTYTLDTSAATPEIVGESSSEQYVDIVIDETTDYGMDKTFDFIVPTGTYNPLSFRLFNQNGSSFFTQKITAQNAANVVTRKKLLKMPDVEFSPYVQDFESDGWSADNTSVESNTLQTATNNSDKIIKATAYFNFNMGTQEIPAPLSMFVSSKAKVFRCKWYIGTAAGSQFLALRPSSAAPNNTYMLPARVNGEELTDSNRSTVFKTDDWNIVEWDIPAGIALNYVTIRPCTDASGATSATFPAAGIFFDDFELLW